MSKTVFVIGANSTVARNMLPALAVSNKLITAGRHDCEVYCDVTKEVTIPDGVDVVINFAASLGGTDDVAITDALQTNVLGMLRVCQAAKAATVAHVIDISSTHAVPSESAASHSMYALTKRQADEVASFYCDLNHIPLTVLRPSRIYGDSDDFAKGQPFLYQLIDKAQQGEDITLYGTNDAARNYIHSTDLAEIINRVIEQRTEGVYTCLQTSNTTYSEIAHIAQDVFARGGAVKFLEDKPDVPSDIVSLDSALYERLNYTPAISMAEGIERIKRHREEAKA